MIPFVSAWQERESKHVKEFGWSHLHFKDFSSAELFCSMIRKKRRSYGYTQATKASEDSIQRIQSITKTFRLIRKAEMVVMLAVRFHMPSSDQ
jgi:hypothetical protein